jgi:hypothetical protein
MSIELPNRFSANVTRDKIQGYLLNTDKMPGAAKARFFLSLGFRPEQWRTLERALIEHAQICPVVKVVESAYGKKFEVRGPLNCPDGRSPKVCTIWQLDKDCLEPRLITAYHSNDD